MSRSVAADFTTEKNKLWSRPFCTAKFAFGGAVGDVYVGEFDHTIGGNAHRGVGIEWGEYRSVARPYDGVFQSNSAFCRLINHANIFSGGTKRFTDLWSGIGVEGVEVSLYLNFWRGQSDIIQLLMFDSVMQPGDYTPDYCDLELFSISEKYLDKEVSFTIDLTDFPNADPADVGKRANLIYGSVEKAVAQLVVAPKTGPLRAAVAVGAVTIPIYDELHDALPSSGSVKIGNDTVAYTGKGGSAGSRTLTGASGVTAVHHQNDMIVQVITEYIYLAAGHELKAVSQVYIKRGDKIIPVSATIELANTTLVSGRTLALIKFTTPPLVAIKDLVTLTDTIGVSQTNTESDYVQDGSDETVSFAADSSFTNGETQDVAITFPSQEKTKSSGNFVKNVSVHLGATAGWTGGMEMWLMEGAAERVKLFLNGIAQANGAAQVVGSGYWNLKIRRKNVSGNTLNIPAASVSVQSKRTSYKISVAASKTGAASLPVTSTDDLLMPEAVLFDCEGYKDDGSGTYTGSASARIEKPADVMHHLAHAVAGIPVGRIDTSAFTTARADAPASYAFAGVLTDRASNIRQLLLILGMQSRIRPEWPVDKLTVRFLKSNYGAVSKALTRDNIKNASLRLWRESVKKQDLINKVQVKYGRDWTKSHDDDAAWQKATAPATDATSQTRYGVLEQADRFKFDFIDKDNSTMATDLRDFYKDRYKEPGRHVAITGFLDNVELLPGDLVSLDYLVGASEKFDGLNGLNKFLVEEVGFAPGALSRQQGPQMRFVLREVT